LKAGLDEAGRGPLIGPMYLAVCVTPRPETLTDLGVADSKTFGSGEGARLPRRRICHALFGRCELRWIQIPAHVIDEHVIGGPGLNELERRAAALLLRQVRPPARIVADGRTLFGPLAVHFPQLVAENRADQDFPEVAAASIVAKTFRDDWMENYGRTMLSLGFEVRGGGYPNASTEEFLQGWERRFGGSPPHLRRSWKLRKRQLELF
jgi:ribonuclease HII